jgi:valyl-tRNA synthetase
MTEELAKVYDPKSVEAEVYALWQAERSFAANPADPRPAFCIVIPPPNVTAALHLGHALNNTLQDVLVRVRRMQQYNTLWMPGTDHAGIATQTVVEKRIMSEENRHRTDFSRQDFVARIQAWKDEYETSITNQLQKMGCSCDWDRQRFTMDEVCAKAVRSLFFKLFADGLIYRGKRLVNWDPATQTVLADDEVEHVEIDGHFWYLRYPLVEPAVIDGKTITHITVATTRPETMLGDTAVAMNPRDPRAAALVGRKVRLPIVGREIPIIADEHVVLPDPESADEKAKFSTGFLKVTPAHDPDDYAIGERHGLEIINVMAPDGTISDKHGWQDADAPEAQNLLGMDRFEARQAVVEFFRAEGLLEEVRPYRHPVGHSYRSHVPIEPYLSDQWYVAVKKEISDSGFQITDWDTAHPDLVEERDGTSYLTNTDVPVNSLAGLALAPLLDGRLHFTPERYAVNYRTWLENLRDWPISRQLWWGHQIPVWSAEMSFSEFKSRYSPAAASLISESGDVCISAVREDSSVFAISGRAGAYEEFARLRDTVPPDEPLRWYVCLLNEESELLYMPEGKTIEQLTEEGVRRDEEWLSVASGPEKKDLRRVPASEFLAAAGFVRDQDVLDTWFSSGLWPFSTLGWPEQTPELARYYPGDVLCTAREIITLWVSRMVMLGQYCCGDIPFRDVFIHAMIQDGQGRKMSKSLGNGIDPLVVIDSHGADAMRFTLVSMTTQTQDVRMPLKEIELPDGRKVNSSEKFDLGRNFCNKLWNASRFALMNLAGAPPWQTISHKTNLSDAWILSRLNSTIRDTMAAIDSFRFNELADTLYHFMWDDLCDWYLEIAKVRISKGSQEPKAVLAHCMDVLLRLLHPITPFITEEIWGKLNSVAPDRGPTGERAERLLVTAQWPYADAAAISQLVEDEFALLQDLIRQIRNARLEHNVPPKQAVNLAVEASGALANLISENADLMRSLANVDRVSVQAELGERPANAAAINSGNARLYVLDIIDTAAERSRLTKQAETLRKGIATIEGKLGNDNFLAKAPADLVQRERDRLAKLQAELSAVDAGLAAL